MFINAATFEVTGTELDHMGREVGTVELTISRVTKRVDAVRRTDNGAIITWAAKGKYLTGKKLWDAVIRREADGREEVWFGRDHSARRCLKTGLFHA